MSLLFVSTYGATSYGQCAQLKIMKCAKQKAQTKDIASVHPNYLLLPVILPIHTNNGGHEQCPNP
jgi:hypothetical protein